MGLRGPAPTPTNVLQMRGSWRANMRKSEPKPKRIRPPCPRWLDARARKAWRTLAPKLKGMRVLTEVDQNALARYCQLWSRWREAEEFIAKRGTTYSVRDKEGNVVSLKKYPQVAMADELADKLLRLEQHFGLTPSARTRLPGHAGGNRCDRHLRPRLGNRELLRRGHRVKHYTINEIFYSLQGEGVRAGTANVFVRFTGCNLRCTTEAGPKSPGGFDCDTEYESGRRMTLDEIHSAAVESMNGAHTAGAWMILTGGEPGLQVDREFIDFVHGRGWRLGIETIGSVELPIGLDWITVSPNSPLK